MDATVTEIREARRRIIECRRELARWENRLDELLGLNSGTRKPKRQMLTDESAAALFADARKQSHEHRAAR